MASRAISAIDDRYIAEVLARFSAGSRPANFESCRKFTKDGLTLAVVDPVREGHDVEALLLELGFQEIEEDEHGVE